MTEGIQIALISLAAAGLGSFLGLLFGRRKVKAETAKILTDAAIAMIGPVTKRLDEVETDLEYEKQVNRVYRQTLDDWREGFEILDCQMREQNLTPRWTPSPIPDVPTRPRKGKKQ